MRTWRLSEAPSEERQRLLEQWRNDQGVPTFRLSAHFQEYQQLYHAGNFAFDGLVMEDDKGLLCLAPFTIDREGDWLSYYGAPVELHWSRPAPDAVTVREAYGGLKRTAMASGAKRMKVLASPPALSSFLSLPYVLGTTLNAKIDLSATEEGIAQAVRKSYRSLINWGRRELRTEVLDAQRPDPELFEQMRLFHIQVSGRETRPRETWDSQLQMLKAGQAYAVLCFWADRLVACSLVLHGSVEAYYGVGVNDRELMAQNLGVGHWCIMRSATVAKERGLKWFNLGAVGPNLADKEAAIGKFKAGFSDQVFSEEWLEVRLKEEA